MPQELKLPEEFYEAGMQAAGRAVTEEDWNFARTFFERALGFSDADKQAQICGEHAADLAYAELRETDINDVAVLESAVRKLHTISAYRNVSQLIRRYENRIYDLEKIRKRREYLRKARLCLAFGLLCTVVVATIYTVLVVYFM